MHIPVIAVTASIANLAANTDFSKFDGFLLKPLNKDLLIQEISKFIAYETDNRQLNIQPTIMDKTEKIENVSELLSTLNQEYIPIIDRFNGALEMDEIKDFSIRLADLGTQYSVSYIMKYAEQLKDSVDTFDITATQNLIRNFQNIIKSVREADNEK